MKVDKRTQIMNMNKCVKIMKTDVNFFQKDFTQGGSNIFETTMLRDQTNVEATVFNIFCGGGGWCQQMFETKKFQESNIFWGNLFWLVNKKNNIWMGGGIFFSGGRKNVNKICIKFLFPILIKIWEHILVWRVGHFFREEGCPLPQF